jgi:hypothetical protein
MVKLLCLPVLFSLKNQKRDADDDEKLIKRLPMTMSMQQPFLSLTVSSLAP